jgi:hypothetical protein
LLTDDVLVHVYLISNEIEGVSTVSHMQGAIVLHILAVLLSATHSRRRWFPTDASSSYAGGDSDQDDDAPCQKKKEGQW